MIDFSSSKKTLVVVLGPTAIGKTALAIDLAIRLKTEIVSADSRQFYRKMSIGVAKPDFHEMSQVPHHFIGFLSIDREFNAGQYELEALNKLNQLFETHTHVICTGGSMLYLDALLNGLDELPTDSEVRKSLMKSLEQNGLSKLVDQLQKLDPDYAASSDLNNPRRVIRALEVCAITGKPFSQLRLKSKKVRNFEIVKIGLRSERNWLYERINLRVDEMMSKGLLEEVKSLIPFKTLNALNTVGYQEIFAYLDGDSTLEEAMDLIKQHTRNYAKRQMTWWKRDSEIQWIEADQSENSVEKVLQILLNHT
ncbi:MAG: tRNA (adenosine(37)-N6)-dimethylallyltransferase MiaA [Flavobacteriales bacterium]|nr:tRNA (adenosine(37)-N6)-dimethylallyltransferase MiaA [Flavobacteriales bacterium]